MNTKHFAENPDVANVFQTYPDALRDKLLDLRQLILEVAAENPEVGQIDETLKWGQISYRPLKSQVGTTIRIDQIKNSDRYAMYVPCTTTLLDNYRSIYADTFDFEGDRGIIFNLKDALPANALKHCIKLALTYHLKKHSLL